jgi:hypothetical protein
MYVQWRWTAHKGYGFKGSYDGSGIRFKDRAGLLVLHVFINKAGVRLVPVHWESE